MLLPFVDVRERVRLAEASFAGEGDRADDDIWDIACLIPSLILYLYT